MTIWEKIFHQLHEEGIQYCHWKSNWHLDRSFEGKTDFDLLIAKKDSQRFNQILLENNFKRRSSTADKVFPGMEDFIGMDLESAQLCHFHVHYQLVVGASGRKNYVIDLEEALFKEARMHSEYPIMVPPVELELMILMIRVSLKTKLDWKNLIKSFLGRNIYPDNIKNELNYLYQQCDEEKFRVLVHDYTDTPAEFIKIYQDFKKAFALRRFLALRTVVKKAIDGHQRLESKQLVWDKTIRNLASKNSMSGFASGGICIGFLGCDGVGKSSTVEEVVKWLSWKYSVVHYYMGVPKNDSLGNAITKIARGFRKLGMTRMYQELSYRRNLRNAKIRYKNYRAGLKDKRQGKIVIFDRFPITQFWSMEEPMDGPRIPENHPLSSKERGIYQDIKIPDLLFIMKVTAEESIKRRPDHASEENRIMLAKKIKAIDELIAAKLPKVVEIDTVREQTSVWNDVKRKIWEAN